MKEAFKWIIILITTFIFLYAFVSSYNAESIDHLDYVIVIGVDTIENSDNFSILLNLQISLPFLKMHLLKIINQ